MLESTGIPKRTLQGTILGLADNRYSMCYIWWHKESKLFNRSYSIKYWGAINKK
ncbi:MAG: helix-turn-helix domain-containing protein [Alteromonadaceae bacterium]|nr:helix-turn-helix domain-containing protein [Alteromonadaceae bacterium]